MGGARAAGFGVNALGADRGARRLVPKRGVVGRAIRTSRRAAWRRWRLLDRPIARCARRDGIAGNVRVAAVLTRQGDRAGGSTCRRCGRARSASRVRRLGFGVWSACIESGIRLSNWSAHITSGVWRSNCREAASAGQSGTANQKASEHLEDPLRCESSHVFTATRCLHSNDVAIATTSEPADANGAGQSQSDGIKFRMRRAPRDSCYRRGESSSESRRSEQRGTWQSPRAPRCHRCRHRG